MTSPVAQHVQVLFWSVDAISAAAIGATFMHILPPIAAVLAVVWYIIQIYESTTVQRFLRLRHRRRVRRHKRLEKLNAHLSSTGPGPSA